MLCSKFELIWPEFEYILEELRSGVCFFEGYIQEIATISETDFYQILEKVSLRSPTSFCCRYSTWCDESTSKDWDKDYKLEEYVHMFYEATLLNLHFDYSYEINDTEYLQKLMFYKNSAGISLEIICYREAILNSDNPKNAVRDAITEFYSLFKKFSGNSLFISSDTSDYPESSTKYPDCWIKLI